MDTYGRVHNVQSRSDAILLTIWPRDPLPATMLKISEPDVPVRVGDVIVYEGSDINNHILMPGTSRVNIVDEIRRYGEMTAPGAEKLYLSLENIAMNHSHSKIDSDYDIIAYGQCPVAKYLDHIVSLGTDVDEIPRKLQKNWRRRTERRLRLACPGVDFASMSVPSMNRIWRDLLDNPYAVPYINMDKARVYCTILGMDVTETQLVCGQALRIIHSNSETRGWTCTPLRFLRKDLPLIDIYLPLLVQNYDVVFDFDCLYIRSIYDVETRIASTLNILIRANVKVCPDGLIEPLPVSSFLMQKITPKQIQAVCGALLMHLFIITGGAGTGKTQIVNELRNILDNQGKSYLITSFTGKAVARLHQVTGEHLAMTMDHAIACKSIIKPFNYLIIDEASMVTVELFDRFLEAFPPIVDGRIVYQICLVGDINQLQPIGWGSLMKQLQDSKRVPFLFLDQNHRIEAATETDSVILRNANRLVNRTSMTSSVYFEDGLGFKFIQASPTGVQHILGTMAKCDIDVNDIVIITPYKAYLRELNKCVQDIFVAPKIKKVTECVTDSKGVVWAIGDRVMLTVNMRSISVMNGDEGYITAVSSTTISIRFGTKVHDFSFIARQISAGDDEKTEEKLSMTNISHSFAVTAHKCQGSEYKYVIVYVPIHGRNLETKFINSNLLYMMITRAKRSVWLIADKDVIMNAVQRGQPNRYENLVARLGRTYDPKLEAPLSELCNPSQTEDDVCFEEC